LLELLFSLKKAFICITFSLNNCNFNISKITNKAFNYIKYLDFEILKIITIDNIVELNSFVLYDCILLLQTLKNNRKNKLKRVFKNYITKIRLFLRKESNTIIIKDSTILYLFAFYIQRVIFTTLLLFEVVNVRVL